MTITKRELDICKLLVKGNNNKQIGKILNISSHTVKWHVARILAKFNASNRVHLAFILGRDNVIGL